MPNVSREEVRSGAHVLPAMLLLGIAGLGLTVVAVSRWAPDWTLRLTEEERLLEQAERHARELGYRPESEGVVRVSAGPRFLGTLNGLEPLVETHSDPDLRRQLLSRAPPLRLGVRFWRTVAPTGSVSGLLLEYDCDARLVAASFGFESIVEGGLPPPTGEYFADRLASLLLGDPLPAREETGLGGPVELLYRRGDDMPNAYVYLGTDGSWLAELQPVPVLVVTVQSSAIWDRLPLVQVLTWTSGILAALALGVLLWRLTRRRAGFGQTPLVAAILLVGLFPLIGQHQGGGSLAALIWLYYLLTQVAVILGWTVGEAELREARPAALEHWDRLAGRRPVAETGRQVVLGVSVGCLLAGFLSASGELVGAWGGGYRSLLVVLPEYWTLASPLNQGMALSAGVAFLVGLGGRLGWLVTGLAGKGAGASRLPGTGSPSPFAVRIGVTLGALAASLGWVLVTPVGPLRWALPLALVLGLASAWIVWYCGLLTLSVACVTAVSLPTAVVGWSVPGHLLAVALVASLPVALLVLGWLLWRRAPARGDLRSVVPSYVSDREQEARLAAEVDLLRDLQLALLPAERHDPVPGVELAWRMVPADVVGGDFLDIIEDDEGRLWLAIADVAGHGISCSVLTAYTKAAVNQHAVAGTGPAEALRRIRGLFGRLQHTRRTLVTLLLVVWDPSRRELRVASAGHPPVLLMTDGEVRELGLGSDPLGIDLGGKDREERVRCDGEAVLVAFTDGVGEATSPTDEAFGYERWRAQLATLGGRSPAAILDELLRSVDAHRGPRPAMDDVTAAVVKLSCDV